MNQIFLQITLDGQRNIFLQFVMGYGTPLIPTKLSISSMCMSNNRFLKVASSRDEFYSGEACLFE